MVVLSVLRRSFPTIRTLGKTCQLNGSSIQIRNHGDQKMFITASRWSWHKFKDMFHFYLFLGIIPLSTLVFLANVFIGPAQLKEIPEGYTPEKWEYYEHPVSRWMAKYIYPAHQEEYERYMFFRFEKHDRAAMQTVSKEVESVMRRRGDSTAFHSYRAPVLDYMRNVRKDFETDEREYLGIEGKS